MHRPASNGRPMLYPGGRVAEHFDLSTDGPLYLPKDVREADDVQLAVDMAEGDVLESFTQAFPFTYVQRSQVTVAAWAIPAGAYDLGDQRYLCLRGYDPAAMPSALAVALKRTIAEIVPHTLTRIRHNPVLASESGGKQSRSFNSTLASPYPPQAFRWLRSFDIRQQPVCI